MKIFEEILTNIEDLKKESYIKSILLEYNLSTIFSPIYATNKEVQRFGDVCTSFIILAYSNGCKWLDYRKDRKTVKMEVMKSVLQYTKVQIDDNYQVLISKVIDGQLEEVEMVIYDFVRWQRNGLFETYVALSTQISLCRREASSTFGVNAKTLNDRAKFLENLRALEKDLKGYPTHAQGGVDLRFDDTGIQFHNGTHHVKASCGLCLPSLNKMKS